MRLKAEIERHVRILVEVDVAKYVAAWPAERAKFDGDDEAFVRASIEEDAYDLLDNRGPDVDDGLTVVEDDDAFDIDIVTMEVT